MRGVGQFEKLSASRQLAACLGLAALLLPFALPSAAQMHGPPITTTVGGHFLGPPPTVTSLAGRYLPPPLPSVTSIPNYGYTRWYPYASYNNGYHRRRGYGYGQGTGYSYPAPYYIPLDGYGYDYMGGPDLYSGPPIGPNDPLLHIVAEQPPVRYPYSEPDPAHAPPVQTQPAPEQSSIPDAKPNEPSVLVFRDGHKQEVSNYAIMGQTVYVFDKRTQKIALADLDVPATVKANDDRGLEFKIPAQKSPQKSSDEQQKSAPDEGTKAPANIAAMAP
jgi:hypothetical protein